MVDTSKKEQVEQWLKKLEQESWQLELLVSAFTIFLLIQATVAFGDFYTDIPYLYDINDSVLVFVYFFLGLIGISLKALSLFLILHLMLRGFWIGNIGLRSVQSKIDFKKLRYSEYFTDKLKSRIVSLDNMVVLLDEMCSVIFSLSFLVIAMLLSFGLFLLFMGFLLISVSYFVSITSGLLSDIISGFSAFLLLSIFFTGIIYMIDYFSLGFFKKYKRISKLYYPVYRFYSFITLSAISRSIYYYLISKFSKKNIRLIYLLFISIFLISSLAEYDQHQFFSSSEDIITLEANYYDNLRPLEDNIAGVSIPSNIINGSFMPLFLRYDPSDNEQIKKHCDDFEPMRNNGLNLRFGLSFENGGLSIGSNKNKGEDVEKMLKCHQAIYRVFINDSLYANNKYYFHKHPIKNQKGLMTMLSTQGFIKGENILEIKKSFLDDEGKETLEDYVYLPFWFEN